MGASDTSVGRDGFAERHGLWDEARAEAAARVRALIREHGLDVVRLSFADQHGILRGKTVAAADAVASLTNGCAIVSTLLGKDTAHRTVYPVFEAGGAFGVEAMGGAGDIMMLPDPATLRVLPWAPGTGWMLCDLFTPEGRPVPLCTRRLLRGALADLTAEGYDYVAGLEVEFHVFRIDDARMRPEHGGQPSEPPEVSLLAHGFQYLTETRIDEIDPVIELLRRTIGALGLPLRSMEIEYGPSQFEVTFRPMTGIEAADAMALFRSAAKQVCRRHGYLATFMCRPALANVFPSGWHLHQSLRRRADGANAFVPDAGGGPLSAVGRQFVAGVLDHAVPATVFTTPTVNGYKRFRPMSLAPDRACWSVDNRGAMVRALGGPGDAVTRIENRVGDPAANPYLYLASQVLSGLDGMRRGLEPPPPADEPYRAEAPPLPRSLGEALQALRADAFFRERLGGFVDYIAALKEAEFQRYLAAVTDWEHREYFEMF